MAYPYGTQGAPAVGGGLGGLPRRATAAAATQAVARTRVATTVASATIGTTSTSQYWESSATYGGYPLDVGNSTVLIPYGRYNGTDWNYYISKLTYSDSGLTLVSDTYIGYTSTASWSIGPRNTFVYGGYLYFMDQTGYLCKCDLATMSKSTVSTTWSPPTSGTINQGTYNGQSFSGVSYQTSDTNYTSTFSDQAVGYGQIGWIDLGNGTVITPFVASVGSKYCLVGRVFNTAGTFTQYFVMAILTPNTTNYPNYCTINIRKTGTGRWDVYAALHNTGSTYTYWSASSFDISTYIVTDRGQALGSMSGAPTYTAFMYHGRSPALYMSNSTPEIRMFKFPVDANGEAANCSGLSPIGFSQVTGIAGALAPDPKYGDFAMNTALGVQPGYQTFPFPGPLVQATYDGYNYTSFTGLVAGYDNIATVDPADGSTKYVSSYYPKLLCYTGSDSSSVTGDGYITPKIRVGEYAYITWRRDQVGSNYTYYYELMKG